MAIVVLEINSESRYGMKTPAPRRLGVPKGRKIIARGFILGSEIHCPPGVPKGRQIASAQRFCRPFGTQVFCNGPYPAMNRRATF